MDMVTMDLTPAVIMVPIMEAMAMATINTTTAGEL